LTYELKRLEAILPRIRLNESGCHIWQGVKIKRGYGRLKVRGRNTLAHVFVFETLVEKVPDGLVLDHLCEVELCVNPFHLEPVTQAENVRRSYERRGLKTHCIAGHAFDEANTRHHKGKRYCRKCRANSSREARQRKRNEKGS
jgi:HNH endonuclease